ncbi:NAD-dependent epimerase/dehydratase family protein [Comamonadaceae bacterium G21597-S1]|nr:NAD-dependent epimerase/dehydratase family protein [Comamonadaceae bacterium G21597-S1]
MTGATGLLGSWLVPALHRRGADVTVLVRDALPRSLLVADGWLDKVNVVRGSLSEGSLLRRTFAEYGTQTVFHLGAQTLVGVAKVDPLGTLEANVRGTWLLLEAARQAKVQQVIVASSDKAYGDSPHLPYREDHPLQGRFPYDCSKSCADLISTMYAQTYGLGVAIARCGNLFGGGDLNFSRLIPGVIMATLRGQPFQIRSNGQFVRDFLYVEDAVQAYLELAQGLAADAGLAGQAFNFGLELRPTMLDLTHKVLAIMERSDLPPQVLNVASAEICEQTLDATKARTVLGWKARHGMDDGLRRTVDWYSRHFELLSTQR